MNNDCPNCGAPHTGATRCGYCGTVTASASDRQPLTLDEMRTLTDEALRMRRGLKRPKPPMIDLETVWR